MNYIVFDLEFNQKYEDKKDQNEESNECKEKEKNLNLPFEIIQIGAVKLNENFEKLSTFNFLIKPTIHTILHPYVETLTKINGDDINSSETFPYIYDKFIKFIGEEEAILCVWGIVDIKELLRNIKFHNLSTASLPLKYIDVQSHASKYFNIQKGLKIGLKTAIELLDISLQGDFHDAINDAYYTGEVLKKIFNKNIKPLLYTVSSRNTSYIKETVDMNAVFSQFKKMYKRSLTKEEKSMISLAYTMGRTKQFVVINRKEP
jgi:inhibitor of KinA sporulation pathway (predicted exonuclease)